MVWHPFKTLNSLKTLPILVFVTLSFPSSKAFAQFSLNFGYQNPAPAIIGLNGQYLDQTYGIEVGLGYAKASAASLDDDKRRASFTLVGDVNGKYLFLDGAFRPYLSAGVTLNNNYYLGSTSGMDLSTGPPFAGLGAIIGSKTTYGYLGVVYLQSQVYMQAGLGTSI